VANVLLGVAIFVVFITAAILVLRGPNGRNLVHNVPDYDAFGQPTGRMLPGSRSPFRLGCGYLLLAIAMLVPSCLIGGTLAAHLF
jgi:hypothetical protein